MKISTYYCKSTIAETHETVQTKKSQFLESNYKSHQLEQLGEMKFFVTDKVVLLTRKQLTFKIKYFWIRKSIFYGNVRCVNDWKSKDRFDKFVSR